MPASNYPDDIRSYDNTPGSPYYNPPWEECTHPECTEDVDPEEADEDGRCSEECAVRHCGNCDADMAECGGCPDET